MDYIKLFEEFDVSDRIERYGKSTRSVEIEGDNVLEVIKKYAPWYNTNTPRPIFRGAKKGDTANWDGAKGIDADEKDYMLINPSEHKRKSAYSVGNYYSEIMSNSKYWKDYPKRESSIVCTTSVSKASEYGEIYRVIPLKENSRFGVCSSSDIYYSFNYLFQEMQKRGTLKGDELSTYRFNVNSMGSFNGWMDEVMDEFFETQDDRFYRPTYDEIKSYMEKISNSKMGEVDINDFFVDKISIPQGQSFLNVLEDWMDPKANKFDLINYNNNTKIDVDVISKEVWTDADCLLVKESLLTS